MDEARGKRPNELLGCNKTMCCKGLHEAMAQGRAHRVAGSTAAKDWHEYWVDTKYNPFDAVSATRDSWRLAPFRLAHKPSASWGYMRNKSGAPVNEAFRVRRQGCIAKN